MKARILTLLLLAMCLCASASADKNKGKQLQGLRQVSMTERLKYELNLDDPTAVRFTLIYNQYVEEMHAAYKKHPMIRPQNGADGKKGRLSDEQIKRNIEARFNLSQSILDLRRKYYKEFLKILTPRQIEKVFKLEKKQANKVQDLF